MVSAKPDDPSKLRFKFDTELSERSIKLELLNEELRVIGLGTGFIIREREGPYLYTNWHVVTGYNFMDLEVKDVPKRRFVRLRQKKIHAPAPGVIGFGDEELTTFPLYDDKGKPLWEQEEQERPNADLNQVGLRVPKHCDLVRLRVSLGELPEIHQTFIREDIWNDYLPVGTPLLIAGYPYGYSAFEFPEPVFLTRAIASNWCSLSMCSLIDGIGANGMSGSPVFVKLGSKWAIFGVYCGAIFPDYDPRTPKEGNDKQAALGIVLHIRLGRIVLGVPDYGAGALEDWTKPRPIRPSEI
jgi:hypothetical protein